MLRYKKSRDATWWQSLRNRLGLSKNSSKVFKKNQTDSIRIRNRLLLSAFIITIFSAIFTVWYLWDVNLVSPLSSISQIKFLAQNQILGSSSSRDYVIYGFLPYWNIRQVKIQPELTHLSYFGLGVDDDGTIIIRDEDGNLHPGYNKLSSDQMLLLAQELEANKQSFEIALVQFNPDKIQKLANNPEAHQNLLRSLDSILLAYPVNGINIDIEYSGEVTPELRDDFASLIEKISRHLDKKYNHVQLSIDVYATAATNQLIWDMPRISRAVDYIIVMAYDFHRTSSTQAGPVAPLFGGQAKSDGDIHQNLRELLRYVPNEKILLGIPFYGYQWQTDSKIPKANTYPDSGVAASYQQVQELLTKKDQYQIETGWDDQALCPYLSFVEDGKDYVIYYENPTSIGYKLEYVRQLDLAGVAIWALGYEGQSRELWEVVETL